MPLVSAITEQKRKAKRREANKDKRFNVFLDGKYSFSIGEEHLIKIKLKEGQVLDHQSISAIKAKEDESRLLDKAINFLSYRPRSEKEINDYLIKSISKQENIKWSEAKESSIPTSILQKLQKYGYVNDKDFAKWWVDSRTKARPKGRRLVALELKRKGITEEIIEKVLPKSSTSDINLALKVLDKKRAKLATLKGYQVKQKAYYYLNSRGFDLDTFAEAFAIFSKKE